MSAPLSLRGLWSGLLTGLMLLASPSAPSLAAEAPRDPLNSAQWPTMYELYLSDGKVVFDEHVNVLAPAVAENSNSVPVMVRITGLADIEAIVAFADYNPLPKILEFVPAAAVPQLGFRLKLQQSSPIRAAARTGEGVWHVGGTWVDAAGGGCTLPSAGRASSDWAAHLGEVSGRLWPRENNTQRLIFSIVHPMDTGLANGIPAFHIETLNLSDETGQLLARLKLHEPVAENPVFALDLYSRRSVQVSGRDNNGNTFRANVGL